MVNASPKKKIKIIRSGFFLLYDAGGNQKHVSTK
jgi:hypothetical protein